MSLWEYANPVKFLGVSTRILPFIAIGAAACLSIGLVWGFFFTPDDYRQGSTVKIIYLHVPSALMAINAWFMMLVASLIWLIRRHHVSALAAKAAAPVGVAMTLIALFTGAIWGQPMWGTYWVWDPRLTAQLILLFLYLGFMGLRASIDDVSRADRASAVLALVGVVNLPIIRYSVEWWNSIHQAPSVMKMDRPSMPFDMLAPLLAMLLGFSLYFGAVLLIRLRAEILRRERNASWIREELT